MTGDGIQLMAVSLKRGQWNIGDAGRMMAEQEHAGDDELVLYRASLSSFS